MINNLRQKNPKKKNPKKKKPEENKDQKMKKSSSSSSSSSSDSDSDEKTVVKKPEDVPEENNSGPGKKRKASEIHGTPEENDRGNFSDQKRQRSNSGRFQRVDSGKTQFENSKLANNSYFSKGGESWGARAQEDLGKVKGNRFRHEKTKKKRGSYRGGEISYAINSVPLCSDSDEEDEREM